MINEDFELEPEVLEHLEQANQSAPAAVAGGMEAAAQEAVTTGRPGDPSRNVVIVYRRGIPSIVLLPLILLAVGLAIVLPRRGPTVIITKDSKTRQRDVDTRQATPAPSGEPAEAKAKVAVPPIVVRTTPLPDPAATGSSGAEAAPAEVSKPAAEKTPAPEVAKVAAPAADKTPAPPEPAVVEVPRPTEVRSPLLVDAPMTKQADPAQPGTDLVAAPPGSPGGLLPAGAPAPVAAPGAPAGKPAQPAASPIALLQPEPPTEVTKEQVLEDIKREAQSKKAAMQKIEASKPAIRGWEISESVRKANAARARFHDELRDVLKRFGDQAGPEIDSLCNRYGRSADTAIHEKGLKELKTRFARVSQVAKVDMLRKVGLPEPMVFDFLANEVHRTMKTRGGPQNPDEVMIWTARLILTMPPAQPKKTASSPRSEVGASRPFAQAVVAPANPAGR